MGRAIDMEKDIERIFRKIRMIEPALEKVINWIAEQEAKDDNKKQRESKTVKKSTKKTVPVSDVQGDS
jgi:hypothetical protein